MQHSTLDITKKLTDAGFNREFDTTSMSYTDFWLGKPSFNGAIVAYVIVKDANTVPEVEYTTTGYPDLSFLDAQDYAQEIYDYTTAINTDTVFSEPQVFGAETTVEA